MVLTAGRESHIGRAEARLADHTARGGGGDTGYDKKELVTGIEVRQGLFNFELVFRGRGGVAVLYGYLDCR